MSLDIRDQRAGMAAVDKITLSSLLKATSSTLNQVRISTFHQARVVFPLGRSTSEIWPVPLVDAVEDEDREWDSIVSKPHVRQALRRMAAEARQQYHAGETKEGGFVVE
jgi:hypothetical protein